MKPHALFLVLLATACTDPLPLAGAPCPCAAGTVCDLASGRCVSSPGAPVEVPDALAPDALTGNDAAAVDPPEPSSGYYSCLGIGFSGVDEVTRNFIGPRCGVSVCHGPGAVFPPKDLDKPALVRSALVDRRGSVFCKNELYINSANPGRSYLLATIEPVTTGVTCPSGEPGGTRMPNKTDPTPMPTVPGPRLSEREIACLRWWVFELAKP
jgi:hypothetical protein